MNAKEIYEAFDAGDEKWFRNGGFDQKDTLSLFWAEALGIDVEWPEHVKHD
jgi:hypothetical protein